MSDGRWVRWAAALGGLLLAGAAIWSAYRYMEPRQRAREIRAELRGRRVSARSCQVGVSGLEADLRAFDERVDSLRERVSGYESLHPDGVPADSFQVYLRVFDEYNAAVEEWRVRADALERDWRACTDVVEEHNVLADSLRDLLVEIGEMEPTDGDGRT